MQDKENIEKLINEALAEEKIFQYHEEDWKELEARLDEDDRKKRGIFWWYFPRIAAVGLLLVGAYFGFQMLNQTKPVVATEESKQSIEETFDNKTKNDLFENTDTNNTLVTPQIEVNPSILRTPENNGSQNPINLTPAIFDKNVAVNSTQGSSSQVENEFSYPIRKTTINEDRTIATTNPDDKKEIQSTPKLTSPSSEPPQKEDSQFQQNTPSKTLKEVPEPGFSEQSIDKELVADHSKEELEDSKQDPIENEDPSETKVAQKKKNNLSKFSLALSLNPMATNSTLSGSSKAGFGGGLKGSYDVSQKVTLSTGVYYSVQNHQTPGTDYQGIQGYWDYYTNSQVPVDVDAAHQVVEFPLQLEVQLFNKEQNKVYAITGVNNSVTFNEQHNFNFDGTGPLYNNRNDSWTVKNDNLRLLNHVKLAAGYETSLTKKVNIGIEPFVNVPLKSTEWGQLDLLSKGVSFNFSLQKKSKEE